MAPSKIKQFSANNLTPEKIILVGNITGEDLNGTLPIDSLGDQILHAKLRCSQKL